MALENRLGINDSAEIQKGNQTIGICLVTFFQWT